MSNLAIGHSLRPLIAATDPGLTVDRLTFRGLGMAALGPCSTLAGDYPRRRLRQFGARRSSTISLAFQMLKAAGARQYVLQNRLQSILNQPRGPLGAVLFSMKVLGLASGLAANQIERVRAWPR